MSGLRRVIVGVSGSPGSIRALRYAEDLARLTNALLVPALAWRPPAGDVAERQLHQALDVAWGGRAEGLAVWPLVQRGEAGPVLAAIAGAEDDVLVVGAGRRGPGSWFGGGCVTRYCLRHAGCPVIAVPPAPLPAVGGLRGWAFRHRELTLDRVLHG